MNKLFIIIAFLLLNLFFENDSFSQELTQLQFSEISNMGSYGRSVSNAGDVNNDGFSDIIIGALSENMNTGAAFIYLGGIHMDTISDINFSGESEYTDFGISVSGAGDVNGDGFDDVIIGASRINSFKGKAYVFFGGQNMNNIPDVIINGESIGSDFGGSVSGGDLNGDGYSDLIIGAPGYSTNQFFHAGRIYIYYGGVNMDTIPDVVFTGETAYSELGSNVICSGDFNGDGYSDIGVGAYYYNLGKGRAYIFFGSLNMDDIPDVVMTGVAGEDHGLGACIANAGDVNNDSYTDLIVGDGYTNYIGKAKLYFGGPGMDSIADKVFYGETNNDWFAGWGSEVSGAGDINHDGFDDVIIGAHANSYGKVYVYFGSDNMNTEADLILNGENGFANFGFSVSGAGDINADGYSDFLIGADSYPQGKAYLYYYSGSLNNYVSATTPVMNTVNADKSTDISIVFNRDMNVSTLTGNNIKVNAEYTGIVPVNISYNPSLKTLIIDPQNDFRAGEKISVTLTSGIQTLNNLNVHPYIFSFLIEATGGTGKFHITDSMDVSGNVKIGDVDVDGDIDLIVGNALNSIQEVKIYKNDGHGHFSYFRDVQGAYQSFIVADFDSDGDPDILSEAENDQVRLFLNDGLGNFSPSLLSGGFIGKPADLDGDGDPDIAGIYTGYDVITAKNENGLFVPRDPVNIPVHCQEPYYYSFPFIEIADMDNDGDPDIAEFTLSYFDFISGIFTGCRSLEIMGNSGSGIFTNSTLQNENFVEGYSVLDKYSYTVLNYDNDDDVDILTSFSKGTNLGNGTYQFEPVQNIFNTIHSADFDGDGDLDITSVAYRTIPPNRIFLLNDGYGNFNIDSILNSNDLSEILYIADFDGDGDIDILESNNSKLMIASNVNCEISGPSNVLVNSQPVAFSVSENVGFWILSNYDQTQATIVSGDEDDTVIVDPGGVTGHFVLYYQDNRTLFCAKHVYVDAPLPVELSAFTFSVNARDIVLNWTTSCELNNSGFEIERAVDNGQLIIDSWDKAGFVEGNGTTNEPKQYTFTDKNLPTGNYKYRLKQIDFNGNFEYFELSESVNIGVPDKYSLSQNYPNPFNPVTNLEFGISDLGFVTLKIYDAVGREVVTLVNEIKEPGYYTIKFNASNLSSGVYFYRITAGDFVAVKKFVVLK